MTVRRASLLAFCTLLFTSIVSSPARAEFDVIDGWDGQLFPSFLVATATMREPGEEAAPEASTDTNDAADVTEETTTENDSDATQGEAESDEEEWEVLGNDSGPLGVVIVAPEDETYVTVEIEAPGILEVSRWSGTLDTADTEYTIYPPLRFNYKALVANKQAIPVAVTYRVWFNDDEAEEHTETLTLRSVNDCPFAVVWDDENAEDVSYMFAAYVNEQHPFVDKILREALNRGIVDSFTGYQSNDPAQVYRQVYAIWDALSQRDVRYSNITAMAADNSIVKSQHIRLIDESINNAQANCVDGSVLLASLLRKIDIEPALVFVPGHCFIAFALDPEGKQWAGLETTMIGSPIPDKPEIIDLGAIVDAKWNGERSWGTFRSAVTIGGNGLSANEAKFTDPNDASHRVISIAAARKRGVLPIAFDASEKFLSSADPKK